jgi:hypothetical protein|tara:strand:+ start:203 stop:370 length:168 start_codon:yes stop_codon:yes gene_type:complete
VVIVVVCGHFILREYLSLMPVYINNDRRMGEGTGEPVEGLGREGEILRVDAQRIE